jgi:hypothetical protein
VVSELRSSGAEEGADRKKPKSLKFVFCMGSAWQKFAQGRQRWTGRAGAGQQSKGSAGAGDKVTGALLNKNSGVFVKGALEGSQRSPLRLKGAPASHSLTR